MYNPDFLAVEAVNPIYLDSSKGVKGLFLASRTNLLGRVDADLIAIQPMLFMCLSADDAGNFTLEKLRI